MIPYVMNNGVDMPDEFRLNLESYVDSMIHAMNRAGDKALRQAIIEAVVGGDFVTYMVHGMPMQAPTVVYKPYAGINEARRENKNLRDELATIKAMLTPEQIRELDERNEIEDERSRE